MWLKKAPYTVPGRTLFLSRASPMTGRLSFVFNLAATRGPWETTQPAFAAVTGSQFSSPRLPL